jgi:hypothetical protein
VSYLHLSKAGGNQESSYLNKNPFYESLLSLCFGNGVIRRAKLSGLKTFPSNQNGSGYLGSNPQ